jgi:hypothetical protein
MIHNAYDDNREYLERKDPQLLRWRDTWLAENPHRSLEHWIIVCGAAAGDEGAEELSAQFPGLMEEYENWLEPD